MRRNADMLDLVQAGENGHLYWRGKAAKMGRRARLRPTYRTGKSDRKHPERVLFESFYDVDIGRHHVKRQCEDPQCISPSHHLPAGPGRLLKALVACVDMRTALCAYLRSKRRSDDLGGQRGISPDVTADIGSRLGVPPLAVLAAYGRVLREQAREAGRDRTLH